MKDRDWVCPHEPRTRLGHLLDPTEMCDFVQRYTLARSILLRAVCYWWWWLDNWICIRSMLHGMVVVYIVDRILCIRTYRVIDSGYNLSNYYFAQNSIPIGIVMIKQIFQFCGV